ncbi:MAG TPA: glycosyltransferase family 2 protein [Humisphaera sp.]
MPDTGIIAIGRNEGDRLRRCLASVLGRGRPVVYVDSNSSDGSPAMAREMGAEVVDLDMSIPFSAARARNEGFARLMAVAPGVKFVLMVDGDCEVVDGFIERAERELAERPKAAVVCGRRRERFPEASVYNRLADVEWDTPVGEARSCGGDALFRVDAFKQAGGYDNTVVAGEEPELCQRLREAGWTVHRIDAEMTVHDSAMFRFGQWWKRSVRSGYGAMDVATRFRRGKDGLFVKQVKSARMWSQAWVHAFWVFVLVVPIALLISGAVGGKPGSKLGWEWAWHTLAHAVVLIGLYLLLASAQAARLALKARRRVGQAKVAAAYGVLTVVGKWAHWFGQVRYSRDRKAGKLTRNIDYKSAGGSGGGTSGKAAAVA